MNCVSDVDFEIEQAFGILGSPSVSSSAKVSPLLGSLPDAGAYARAEI